MISRSGRKKYAKLFKSSLNVRAFRDMQYTMSIGEVQALVQTLNDESGLDIGTGMWTSANEMTLLTTKGAGGQLSSGIRRNR